MWQRTVGIDNENGKIVVFDAECPYAQNEMKSRTTSVSNGWFDNWLTSPELVGVLFQLAASYETLSARDRVTEPAGEWDDRNKLYSICLT